MTERTIKYVVIPGRTKSIKDGDFHFVNARDLVRLYGVEPVECKIFSEEEWSKDLPWNMQYKDLPQLRPLYSGRYREFSERLTQ